MPYLASDICSKLNPSKCYGRAGAEVIIVRDAGGGILLVRLANGNTDGFAVFKQELIDELSTSSETTGAPEQAVPGRMAARKAVPGGRPKRPHSVQSAEASSGQPTLF